MVLVLGKSAEQRLLGTLATTLPASPLTAGTGDQGAALEKERTGTAARVSWRAAVGEQGYLRTCRGR